MKNKLSLLPLAAFAATTLFSGCLFDSEEKKSNDGAGVETKSAVVAFTSDYTTGALRWVSGDSIPSGSIAFNSDSKIVAHGQTLYVMERTGADNLVILDLETLPSTEGIKQVALEDGANPMDLVVVNDTLAWVALYGKDYLLAINPKTGKAKDSIDIGDYKATGSSVPMAQSVLLYGDTLIVLLQRLGASYAVEEKGMVVLMDAYTGKIIDDVELKGKNPFGGIVLGSKLLVSCQGDAYGNPDFDDTKSLDQLDLKTGEVKVLTTSKNLGGGPTSLAYDEANDILYIGSYRKYLDVAVAQVNPNTGAVISKAIPDVKNAFGGIAYDAEAKLLYVGEQVSSTEGALLTWDGKTTVAIPGKKLLPMASIAVTHW